MAQTRRRPSSRFLHPITEFRCAAQVIANALTAEREGYDAFEIGGAGGRIPVGYLTWPPSIVSSSSISSSVYVAC
jgi:hypothetical protein